MMYAVSRAWTTDLEPGTWYEIVDADRPQIIAGFVFEPPGTWAAGRVNDYRDVDGKMLPRTGSEAKMAGFDTAVRASKEDTATS